MSLPRIYVALDTDNLNETLELAARVAPSGMGIKLGMRFYYAEGPQGVRKVMEACPDTSFFIDLKCHDIPKTAAEAIDALCTLKPDYVNVHASGGLEMMQEVAKIVAKYGDDAPKVLAVTVLTSLNDENLDAVGQKVPAKEQVVRLAKLTKEAGLSGVVCSAHEIEAIRAACGDDFALMVPGIRPAGSAAGDQKRVMTPAEAVSKGATHLVIGRPITKADDAQAAVQAILESI